MLLREKQSGELVKIQELESLFSPSQEQITGQIQAGQEEQSPQSFAKEALEFPSGEDLPRCWLDADYRAGVQPT